MWKVLRAFSGGAGSSKMSMVPPARCFNCTRTRVSFISTSKDEFASVISRSYSLSRIKMTNGGVDQKADIDAIRERAYKSSREKNDSNRIPSGGWFLLVIPISTLALGVWQVFRWRWKLGLIEEMRVISIADPVPLPEEESELEGMEYRKVSVRGTFDYSNEVLIGPRSLVNYEDRSAEKGGRGLMSSSTSNNGYHVITPFQLEGRNESILVNRGWINSRSPNKFKHVEETVDIIGIVRKTENRAPFMSKNRPGQTLLHYRDVATMAALLNSKEVFLDLYSIEGVDFSNARQDSIPVPRQTRITLRNEHVSYFVTWFSLSAITSLMWHRRFIRRLNLL